VDETIHESMKRFLDNGLFFSASDADSEGREGGYFIYSYDEVAAVLAKQGYRELEIEENLDYFGIEEIGNFKGEYSNPQLHTGIEIVPAKMQETKKILQKIRESRVFPFVDKKVITAWNAMMIKALFVASKIDTKYLHQARIFLDTLLQHIYHDRVLYHQYMAPKAATKKAFLEDYAFLIDALIAGYEATYESRYLSLAEELTKETIKKFYHDKRWYLDEKQFALAQYNDKYYTSPLGRFYHDMLAVAYLRYDLKFLEEVKNYIKEQRDRIISFIDASPEAARALLRINSENILLKSTKENLLNSKADSDKIFYPFFLTKVDASKMFLLCNETSCFFYDKNSTKVINKVNSLKK